MIRRIVPREPLAVLCRLGTEWPARLPDGRAVHYDSRAVWTAEELERLRAEGWCTTLAELAEPAAPTVAAPTMPVEELDEAPEDNAPPTRSELEEKAQELGIKVDRRWGDRRLLEAIESALAAQE